jgi:5-methylcytosine-specific restriction endonuclease McrA
VDFRNRQKKEKTPKRLQARTPLKARTKLKANRTGIPTVVKINTLILRGNKCFMGLCEVCGGQSFVTLEDDFHHYPHRSRGGKDIPEHLWPCKRECHDYMHDHPVFEREMFKRIEAAGIAVVWKVEVAKQAQKGAN